MDLYKLHYGFIWYKEDSFHCSANSSNVNSQECWRIQKQNLTMKKKKNNFKTDWNIPELDVFYLLSFLCWFLIWFWWFLRHLKNLYICICKLQNIFPLWPAWSSNIPSPNIKHQLWIKFGIKCTFILELPHWIIFDEKILWKILEMDKIRSICHLQIR